MENSVLSSIPLNVPTLVHKAFSITRLNNRTITQHKSHNNTIVDGVFERGSGADATLLGFHKRKKASWEKSESFPRTVSRPEGRSD